jgi:hypothetical protein
MGDKDGVFSHRLRSMVALSRNKPSLMKDEDWVVLEIKERSLIRICLTNLVLLNVSEEPIMTSLLKNLGDLYQAKCLANKLFFYGKSCMPS